MDSNSVTSPSTNASARSTPLPSGPPESPSKLNANRTLLLGGRKDGHICVFNMETGVTEFEIEVCSLPTYIYLHIFTNNLKIIN